MLVIHEGGMPARALHALIPVRILEIIAAEKSMTPRTQRNGGGERTKLRVIYLYATSVRCQRERARLIFMEIKFIPAVLTRFVER